MRIGLSGGTSGGGGSLTGSGSANQVAYWTSGTNLASSANFLFDATNVTVVNPMYFSTGTAALPSITRAADPNCGIFWGGDDILAFSTAGTERGNINPSGVWTIGTNAGNQNHLINGRFTSTLAQAATVEWGFYKDAAAGDTTTSAQINIGNSGSGAGLVRFNYTNAAATGSPSALWSFDPRNNADTTNYNASQILSTKVSGNDGAQIAFRTSTTTGTITTAATIDELQCLRVGVGSAITFTNERVSSRYTAVTADAALQNTAGYFQYSNSTNTAFSSNQNGLVAEFSRTISSSTADTSTSVCALTAQVTISTGAATYTATNLHVAFFRAPSITGTYAGTFSNTHIETHTTSIGTRKIGLRIGPQSGNTTVALLADNTSFSGAYALNLVSTNPSDFGGQIQGPSGTASAPSFSFSTDPDTGIFRSAANTLAFATSTSLRGTVDGTGIWTIGTASSSVTHVMNGNILSLVASTTTTEFALQRSTTTASLGMYGGTGTTSGRITLYGSTHASLASVTEFLNGSAVSGSISSAQLWTIGASAGTNAHVINGNFTSTNAQSATVEWRFYKDATAGASTNPAQILIGNSGTNAGVARLNFINAAATGAPASVWAFDPRNNADTTNFNAAQILMEKTAASDGGTITFRTSTTGGTLTTALVLGNDQTATIGTGTAGTHRFNTATEAASAGVLTLTNGPGASTGNPAIYVRFNFNGTTYVVPAWTF